MILMPSKPSLKSSVRRVRNAFNTVSPISGNASTAWRSAAAVSSSTSPGAVARPVTSEARPDSVSTSPVNSPGS